MPLLPNGQHVGPLLPSQVGKTTADSLLATAASMREVAVQLGLRPYRTFVVRGKWSGSRVGEGTVSIVQRVELVPAPEVKGLAGLSRNATQGGLAERGDIKIVGIQPKTSTTIGWDEDDLLANSVSKPLGPTEFFWYEIQKDGSQDAGVPFIVRHFRLRGSPEYDKEELQWIVRLERSEQQAW